ncbi:hypothetical protein SAMN05720468_11813 [Fibrobacter sp. UWEL]|nr:hypothetical protein SAMN05720468_11813 [Fibrobacter sp. UWEL]
MKKSFMFILGAAALFTACSESSTAESIANASNDAADKASHEVAQVEELKLPIFFFGENGERLTIDAASGKKVAKVMNREKLVVADAEAFDDLLDSYAQRLKSDKAYYESIEKPGDYACTAEYLAATADYESVSTEAGEVLLDDKVLFNDCVYAGDSKALKKTYTDASEIDSVSYYTMGKYRVVGRSRIMDLTNPGYSRWRNGFFQTWALSYVSYMGHMIYYPVPATSVKTVGRLVRRCGYNTFNYNTRKYDIVSCDAGFNSSWIGYGVDHVDNRVDGEEGTEDVGMKYKLNGSSNNTGMAAAAKHVVTYGSNVLVTFSAFNIPTQTMAKDVIKKYVEPVENEPYLEEIEY